MIGDGHGPDQESWLAPRFGTANSFARRTLRERLEAMRAYFPLETFGTNAVFDPEDWDIGTVTLLDREVLRRHQHNPSLTLDNYASLAVPARPTDLHPNLDPNLSGVVVYQDNELGITYRRVICWGVVAPTRQGRRTLEIIPAELVSKSPKGGKVSVNIFLPYAVPVTVGATRHEAEWRLERTNILQVHSTGLPERQERKSWIRAFLGRFATGNT
jgi:hypothetical protein